MSLIRFKLIYSFPIQKGQLFASGLKVTCMIQECAIECCSLKDCVVSKHRSAICTGVSQVETCAAQNFAAVTSHNEVRLRQFTTIVACEVRRM